MMLQDICESNNIFGGKITIFGGDFGQVLIVSKNSQFEVVEASLVGSALWCQF